MATNDTQNQAWAKDKSSFGYRMLLKQGWKEGGGLGKEGTGMASHVKVTKRVETVGLGAESDVTGNASLTAAVSSFNSILQALGQYHAGSGSGSDASDSDAKKKKKKSKKDKKAKRKAKKGDKGSKDADLKKSTKEKKAKKAKGADDDATARRNAKKADKRRRAEAAAEAGAGAGSKTLGSAARLTFRKRAVAKDVKAYSAVDMAAILCGVPTASTPPAASPVPDSKGTPPGDAAGGKRHKTE